MNKETFKYHTKYDDTITCTIFTDTEEGSLIAKTGYCETTPQDYSGVTTVLNATQDKSFLVKWRERIGDVEADRIVAESISIGKELDNVLYEHFTEDDFKVSDKSLTPTVLGLYNQVSEKLKHIEPIACQLKVTSHKHKTYGFIDMLCMYRGKLTLLDFKNSRRLKDKKELRSYLLQCTMYCMFLLENYGIVVKQIVLLIALRDSSYPQVVIEETKNYVKEAIECIGAHSRITRKP